MFRWWWPSHVDAATAVKQLEQVAKAGYKGVEIAFVMDGTTYVVDPSKQYGDASWRGAVKAVLKRAIQLDLQVDLTLGGRWPAAIPGLDVSSEAASQELVTARAVVAPGATFADAAPAPTPRTYQERSVVDGAVVVEQRTSPATLVSAVAAKCSAACAEATPVVDLNSAQPLEISGGSVEFTAPAGETWVVIAGWQRGTTQRNDAPFGTTATPLSSPESRVINHFDAEGTEAFIRYFSRLFDSETRRLLKANGGSIFEDSLELKGTQLWTADFADTFEEQHGYDLAPFLPAIAFAEPSSPFAPKVAQFAVPTDQENELDRVRHDVDATLEKLWATDHVAPITEWAHGLGLKFRAQPYGEPIDLGSAAAALDISECESLGCSEEQFRTLSVGVTLANKKLVSSEMLPGGFGNLYGLTPAEVAALANREYSLGANQMVFHGLPYPVNPPSADGTIVDNASQWPGFHGFTPNIGEAFGPRQATWTMETDVSGYYTRMQKTLQTGTARWDVAVLNQSSGDGGSALDGAFLDTAGFTYGYVTPGSLAGQKVSGGRLDPDGAAFKALVIGSQPLDLEAAKEVERVAKAGLPIIVLNGGPTKAQGWAGTTATAKAEDKAVRSTISRVLGLPRSFEADNEGDVLSTLADEGIAKSATVAAGIKVVERRSATSTFYVLINSTDEAVTTNAKLSGAKTSVAYTLDPWTGKTARAASSTRSGLTTTVKKLTIEAGGSAIVALASKSFAGTQGKAVKSTAIGAPAAVELPDWDLSLDEYLPGGAGDPSSYTKHVTRTQADVGATPWSELDGFENSVGVGSYTTTLRASSTFAAASAVLDLGDVSGSFRVFVNGKRVGVANQFGSTVDIGSALKKGTNTIRVDVASTLLNQLRVHRPADFGDREPTVNGLLGPVTLHPYRVVSSR